MVTDWWPGRPSRTAPRHALTAIAAKAPVFTVPRKRLDVAGENTITVERGDVQAHDLVGTLHPTSRL